MKSTVHNGIYAILSTFALFTAFTAKAQNTTTSGAILTVTPIVNGFTVTEVCNPRTGDTAQGDLYYSLSPGMQTLFLIGNTHRVCMSDTTLVTTITNGLPPAPIQLWLIRKWTDSLGTVVTNVKTVTTLVSAQKPTMSFQGSPTNNNGTIVTTMTITTNVVGALETYISFDSTFASYSTVGTQKAVQPGNAYTFRDTIYGMPTTISMWLKKVIKNSAGSDSVNFIKVIPYVAPQAPTGVIDSIVVVNTTGAKVFGRVNTFGLQTTVRVIFKTTDTVTVVVAGSSTESTFTATAPNRVLDYQYNVKAVLSSVGGNGITNIVPFIIPSNPALNLTITNVTANIGPSTATIGATYGVPSGVINLYFDYATDSNFTVPLDAKTTYNVSGSGTASQTFSGLSIGTYWGRIQGVYNNKLVSQKIQFTITTVGINDATQKLSISVYPNPCIDFISVPSSGNYTITSITGQKITEGFLDQSNSLDVKNLKSGMYILIMDNGSYARFQKR